MPRQRTSTLLKAEAIADIQLAYSKLMSRSGKLLTYFVSRGCSANQTFTRVIRDTCSSRLDLTLAAACAITEYVAV